MTEESFQRGRKIMQQANYIRGLITKAKGDVAKWTKIEDCYIRDLKEAQAKASNKMLQRAMAKLDKLRGDFKLLEFPESNIQSVGTKSECQICGNLTPNGVTLCDECLLF